MIYEPFDALYWPAQLGAERRAMPSHRASFATTLMGLYKVPVFLHQPLKLFDSRVVQNYPHAALNRAFGALVLLRTTRQASEQFRIGPTIHIPSKVL
jgi:hypothetical protein